MNGDIPPEAIIRDYDRAMRRSRAGGSGESTPMLAVLSILGGLPIAAVGLACCSAASFCLVLRILWGMIGLGILAGASAFIGALGSAVDEA